MTEGEEGEKEMKVWMHGSVKMLKQVVKWGELKKVEGVIGALRKGKEMRKK